MKYLFIGQCFYGSTSGMRYSLLRELINTQIDLIDISDILNKSSFISRSLGWRYYFGPAVDEINLKIDEYLVSNNAFFDFIWIDKGVFIYPEQLAKLKLRSKKLIHYTPDTSFYKNNSRHFRKAMDLYDILVTTKSFELNEYLKRVNQDKVLLIPQGYNRAVHFPKVDFGQKEKAITFIGLYELSREVIIDFLMRHGFKIYLGGHGWSRFVKKNMENENLVFLGEKIWEKDYAKAISNTMFGLGLLVKKFPELHTTRTFEIPACGTCLITEKNIEIDSFFNDDEVIKFSGYHELVEKLNYYSSHSVELEELIKRGKSRIEFDRRDYKSQLKQILIHANLTK